MIKINYIESMDSLCGQLVSSWLQTQKYGFGSRRYQIFWEVVGLELGPLSLVSTIEELLERKNYGRMDPPYWPLDSPLSVKVGSNFAD
jgi:hypothetical protein